MPGHLSVCVGRVGAAFPAPAPARLTSRKGWIMAFTVEKKPPPHRSSRLVFDGSEELPNGEEMFRAVRREATAANISATEFVRQCVRHCLDDLHSKAGGKKGG